MVLSVHPVVVVHRDTKSHGDRSSGFPSRLVLTTSTCECSEAFFSGTLSKLSEKMLNFKFYVSHREHKMIAAGFTVMRIVDEIDD